MNSRALLTQGEAILLRKGHPASRRKLTLKDFARYPLVTLSLGGEEEGAVDGFILERGLARQSEMFDRHALEDALQVAQEKPRLRVTVPHSLAIPALLQETDMLSIVPASLALALSRSSDLVRRQPPYAAGTSTLRAVWHRRHEHDAGHAWLRELVATTAKATEQAVAP
jgi:DNA-binding transcriptional LysR family regulator